MIYEIEKNAYTGAVLPAEGELEAINALTRRPLTAEEVFTFRVKACDTNPDRDFECFSKSCLEALLPMFVGRPVLVDHNWSARNQCARIYGGAVVEDGEGAYLSLNCYMLRADETAARIRAIEGGILKEVSIGCACRKMTCSLCGKEYGSCEHQKGAVYDGEVCLGVIEDPVDAYELSFVAVPAQPAAGVSKGAKQGEEPGTLPDSAESLLQIERVRF